MVRTTRGRVVYNRKIHFFSWCDVRRIVGKVQDPAGEYQEYCQLNAAFQLIAKIVHLLSDEGAEAAVQLEMELDKLAQEKLSSYRPSDFGGGEFGGAGVTRFWDWLFSPPINVPEIENGGTE